MQFYYVDEYTYEFALYIILALMHLFVREDSSHKFPIWKKTHTNRESMTMMEHQRKYEKPLAKYVKIALVTPTFSWLKSAILQVFEVLFTRSILQIVINHQKFYYFCISFNEVTLVCQFCEMSACSCLYSQYHKIHNAIFKIVSVNKTSGPLWWRHD